ncbi:MAG: GDSL-type esterase/lipase family protein, partial [Pirellulaceae bacterium]|nr:GDSL-type esterase/lipase family protein [Pirellulaceae bacterium]
MKNPAISFWFAVLATALATHCMPAQESELGALLKASPRVVFLGDSITYSGGYVARLDAWLEMQNLDPKPELLNLGLPSETVSGLSEQGHAGGRFPRPDLAERLDRVLQQTEPDLIIACYGINCGIYQDFDEQRFQKYQQGIQNLVAQAQACEAQLILLTPPTFDDKRSRLTFSYDAVMSQYSEWLVNQGHESGWHVIDLHAAMRKELESLRQ